MLLAEIKLLKYELQKNSFERNSEATHEKFPSCSALSFSQRSKGSRYVWSYFRLQLLE